MTLKPQLAQYGSIRIPCEMEYSEIGFSAFDLMEMYLPKSIDFGR